MTEAKQPEFFKYFDYSTGKMKKDAPASAKKAYRDWQKEDTEPKNEKKKR